MFDGAIWKESPKGCDLRNNINTDLYFHIHDLINKYCDMARKATDESFKDMYDKKVTWLIKLSKRVRQNSSKDAILQECAWFFKNADFFDRLDAQRNLIAFENGVYDLEKSEFRKSTSADMISLTTKYNYTAIINLCIRNEILDFFTSTHDIRGRIQERSETGRLRTFPGDYRTSRTPFWTKIRKTTLQQLRGSRGADR
jgi:hypothetical protein